MFITFEGLDSSGKSTQIKLLQEFFLTKNFDVELYREPGGNFVSEKVREILLDKKNHHIEAKTEFLLFASSRAQLVNEKIIPALNKNNIVLCDRFSDSSVAYQGYGRGLDCNFINQVNNFATNNLKPDLTFFIDIPISEITKRREIDKKENDRMETSGIDFYEKVRVGYLNLAKENKERFFVIDGLENIDAIHKKIVKIVIEKL